MSLFSTLKRNAKLALQGTWGRAILSLLIIAGIILLLAVMEHIAFSLFVARPFASNPTMESGEYRQILENIAAILPTELALIGVGLMLQLFLVAPIRLGVSNWFWTLVNGKSMPLCDIFCFFDTKKQYFRMVRYYISLSIRSLCWAVVFFALPITICGVSAWFLRDTGVETPRAYIALATAGLLLSMSLLLIACILYLIYMNKYALTHLLLFEDSELKVRAAIKMSISYTKEYRLSLFLYSLSFIGWNLLTPFTFGLLYLYVGPYYHTSYAMYGRYIIEKNRYIPPDATKEFMLEQAESFTGEIPALGDFAG